MTRPRAVLVRTLLAGVLGWMTLTEVANGFLSHRFGLALDGDVFLILAASSPDETRRFLTLYATPLAVTLLGLLTALAVIALLAFRLRRRHLPLLAGVTLLAAAAGCWQAGSIRAWKPLYFPFDVIRSARAYRQLAQAARWTPAREAAVTTAAPDASNLLFVIGESATTSRMSAYGAAHTTTPTLSREDVACLGPLRATRPDTARALLDMLVQDGASLPVLYRLSGYRTVLVSAQAHWERYCGVEQTVFHACEEKTYLCDRHPAPVYDEELIAPVTAAFAAGDTRPVAMFVHLIGSHFDPADRVPAHFGDGRGLDAYDRSLLYTDRVLGALIDALPPNTRMVYVSDHGETPDAAGGWRQVDCESMWTVPFAVYPATLRERFAGVTRTDELFARLIP